MTKPELAMAEALMTYVHTTSAQWTDLEPGYRRQTLVNDREAGTRCCRSRRLTTMASLSVETC